MMIKVQFMSFIFSFVPPIYNKIIAPEGGWGYSAKYTPLLVHLI